MTVYSVEASRPSMVKGLLVASMRFASSPSRQICQVVAVPFSSQLSVAELVVTLVIAKEEGAKQLGASAMVTSSTKMEPSP